MNISSRERYRITTLLKSLQHTKHLSPEDRFDLFLDLQQSLVSTYWNGLRDRHPELNDDELIKVARKEAEDRVKRK